MATNSVNGSTLSPKNNFPVRMYDVENAIVWRREMPHTFNAVQVISYYETKAA